jgi:hypothetical protein
MQTTDYFAKKRALPEQQHIRDDWIISTYMTPELRLKQSDGRFSLYGKISEMNNQYLRIILLKDGKTVRDAFFVKSFNPRAAARRAKDRNSG